MAVRKGKERKERWSDRWPAVVTREGKGFLWLTVGVAFAALNTGNNLLYLVLSFMLSLLLLSMILAESGIRSLRVERLRVDHVFAGQSVVVRYRVVAKRRWIPVFAVEVREWSEGAAQVRSGWAAKVTSEPQTVAGYIVFDKRGYAQLCDLQVRTSFPFGLVEKRRWFRQEQQLVVYPRPSDPIAAIDDATRSLGDLRAQVGLRSELGELREYVPGDPIRAVHWLRSAALGELVARDHVAQQRPDLVLDLALGLPAPNDPSWREAIERRIGGATRVVLEAAQKATGVSLRYGRHSAHLSAGGSKTTALRFLALLELEKQEEGSAPGSAR